MIVGIFGGSFDPPHVGHVHVASTLAKFLHLNEVWWVITRDNPLKPKAKYCFEDRRTMVQNLLQGCTKTRVLNMSCSRAYEVALYIKRRYSHIKFVWLGGSDNLDSMHKWYRWKDFCTLLPVVLIERNGYIYRTLKMPFPLYMENVRAMDVRCLSRQKPYGLGIVRVKSCNISSSQLKG